MDRKVMTAALLRLLSSLPSSTSPPCHPNMQRAIAAGTGREGEEGRRVVGHPCGRTLGMVSDQKKVSSVRCILETCMFIPSYLGSILSSVGRHPHRHDRPGQGFPAEAGR
ncbi:MAG: hypothetical protein J3Q66DRAFT_320706 [Benniella sp.]|nr:MAG: hypothetical protein J3Q66DRAFT_320706 [Benniella sp.]